VDKEKVEYIINFFNHLLTAEERMAIKHTNSIFKLENGFKSESSQKMFKKLNWITEDKNVLNLLEDGYENFQIKVANRILEQNPEEIFFNECSKCGKLARTPFARQCRYCGNNWHNEICGKFLLQGSSIIIDRGLFLFGELIEGVISKNNLIDLAFARINKKAKILSIENVRKIVNGEPKNQIALQIIGISMKETDEILKFGSTFNPIDIFINE